MSEPAIIDTVRQEVRKGYVCDYCGASRRATVHWEMEGKFEVKLEIECEGFLPGGQERCGHTEIRHYPV